MPFDLPRYLFLNRIYYIEGYSQKSLSRYWKPENSLPPSLLSKWKQKNEFKKKLPSEEKHICSNLKLILEL